MIFKFARIRQIFGQLKAKNLEKYAQMSISDIFGVYKVLIGFLRFAKSKIFGL